MQSSDWAAFIYGKKKSQRVLRTPKHVWQPGTAAVANLYKTQSLVVYQVGQVIGIQYGNRLPIARYQVVKGKRQPIVYQHYSRLIAQLIARGLPAGMHDTALVQLGILPLQMVITEIGTEDVRQIQQQDASEEGFERAVDFWRWWCSTRDCRVTVPDDENIARELLIKRDKSQYQAWVLRLEFAE